MDKLITIHMIISLKQKIMIPKQQKLNQATYSSDLCIQLLNLYTQINDIVYDPFYGNWNYGKCLRNKK